MFEAIPIRLEENLLTLGVREPLSQETIENIEMATYYDIKQQILPNREYYRLKALIKLPSRLGLHLVLKGHLKGDDILDAMAEQRDSGAPLGDILVENQMITREILSKEFKSLYNMEVLLNPQQFMETKTFPWAEENNNIPGYLLKDSSNNLIYTSCRMPHDQVRQQIKESYQNVQFKLLLKQDEKKWKRKPVSNAA